MDTTLLFQALYLLGGILYHAFALVLNLPWLLLKALLRHTDVEDADTVQFYEGHVKHSRRLPIENEFNYPVRVAVVPLDTPPSWWHLQASSHLSADAVRELADTDGRVALLTNPISIGYEQNPISVYYCYDKADTLKVCIAEVTNTPWGERVTFLFDPKGEQVPKALHVSPFMDMQGTWILKASEPGDKVTLYVGVQHPEMGKFFDALLTASRCSGPGANSRCEHAGLRTMLRYGFQPHRVAILIYWQAIVLLWKGATFHSPPCKSFRYQKEAIASEHPPNSAGTRYVWKEAKAWPFREEGGGPDEVWPWPEELRKRGLEKAGGAGARGGVRGGCPARS